MIYSLCHGDTSAVQTDSHRDGSSHSGAARRDSVLISYLQSCPLSMCMFLHIAFCWPVVHAPRHRWSVCRGIRARGGCQPRKLPEGILRGVPREHPRRLLRGGVIGLPKGRPWGVPRGVPSGGIIGLPKGVPRGVSHQQLSIQLSSSRHIT